MLVHLLQGLLTLLHWSILLRRLVLWSCSGYALQEQHQW